MTKKVFPLVLLFMLMFTMVCSAEQWMYIGKFEDKENIVKSAYIDVDSVYYYSYLGNSRTEHHGQGGTLIKLIYKAKNREKRSQIWNTTFYYDEDEKRGDYATTYVTNYTNLYDVHGYKIGGTQSKDKRKLYGKSDIKNEARYGTKYATSWPENLLLTAYRKLRDYNKEHPKQWTLYPSFPLP